MNSYLLLFVLVGLLLVALAVPLLMRRVKPNRFYGLRVPATFADEQVWYQANAASGRDLLAFGLATVALAIVLGLLPIAPATYTMVLAGALAAGAIALAVIGWRRANRLLRERHRASHR